MFVRARLIGWTSLLALACLAVPVPCGADPPRTLRLIENGSRDQFRGIGGVRRRVLPVERAEVISPLGDVSGDRILFFSIGFDAAEARGTTEARDTTVRFEVLLHSAGGERSVVYRRDVEESGWREESISLTEHDLSRASLIFRRAVIAGNRQKFWKSYWGEPIVVPARPERRPSVVLVSIDTLRADLLGRLGPPAAVPALDRLAKAGVTFTEAYSPSSWTLPSHYALLRGVSPGTLPDRAGRIVLPAQRPVALAEVLRDRGYLTAAFTGGGYVSSNFQFADGFDVYYSFRARQSESGCAPDRFDGQQAFGRAEDWLRRHREHPFFLFVHTYDAHDRCGFCAPDARGGLCRFDPTKRDAMVAHYKNGIEGADRLLGRLLDSLAELELVENTLVIVTSDHGEALWEHGEAGHGCEMKPYEELVRVPLVLRYPAKLTGARHIATPTSLIAVAPTILELLGLPVPATMKDTSTLPLQAPPDEGRPVYVHCEDRLAVRDGRHKLIASREGRFRPESYDLQNDPLEKNPLPHDSPAAARLQELAARYWAMYPKRPTPQAKPEKLEDATRERLRALGYNE